MHEDNQSVAGSVQPSTFAPTFTKKGKTKMIKKFALLATMAALFVACGSSTTENMENSADEMMDQAAAEAEAAAAEAEAAAAEAAAAAAAAADTAAAAVEGAVDGATEAVENAVGH
ncbi:MAG: hypothetical protein IPH05_10385 [Flavobacteriales bacterium]|jgi:hypothetical protein|nr:hypothetical protein [Flavobacteriales bacterium]MBK6883331.1 hypothetical protein [Flavobacteriales bacterium]MBK7102973.1 hypothetical protein [Flavobacteriales bacterium]MBK7113925.1 hypothetical protein [Flavobacteriales bacterium]MBK9627295.1 hypothetical protein [Flavobacteriales bacterium]